MKCRYALDCRVVVHNSSGSNEHVDLAEAVYNSFHAILDVLFVGDIAAKADSLDFALFRSSMLFEPDFDVFGGLSSYFRVQVDDS